MVYCLKIKEQIKWGKNASQENMWFFFMHNLRQNQIKFYLFVAFSHIDASKLSDCLNDYNSIMTKAHFST